MNIHHYGFLSRDIEKSAADFRLLGFVERRREDDLVRGVRLLFMESDGDKTLFELIMPIGENSAVKKLVQRQNNTIYHVCYLCDNLTETIDSLRHEFALIGDPMPAQAFEGRKAAFMYSNNAGMIELLER